MVPTRLTIFVLIHLLAIGLGTMTGITLGLMHYGVWGSIAGGICGFMAGHIIGAMPDRPAWRWMFRKIERSSTDELWKAVSDEAWTFYQTLALLQLATRGQDVGSTYPHILCMLGSGTELTRVYGWDAMRLVFTEKAKGLEGYDPRLPTEVCRRICDSAQAS